MGGWLLVGLAAFHVSESFRGHITTRVNAVLHALMASTMSAMLFELELPLLPQIILFPVASLWFIIQAFGRSELNMSGSLGDRIRHLYSACSMFAVAMMLYMSHGVTSREPAPQMGNVHSHTSTTAYPLHFSYSIPEAMSSIFLAGAIAFGFVFIASALRRIRSLQKVHGNRRLSSYAIEAMSASLMAVMFAAPGLH